MHSLHVLAERVFPGEPAAAVVANMLALHLVHSANMRAQGLRPREEHVALAARQLAALAVSGQSMGPELFGVVVMLLAHAAGPFLRSWMGL